MPSGVYERPTRTHCKHGHVLISDTIYIDPSGCKICKLCTKESRRKYYITYPWARHLETAKARCNNKKRKGYNYYGGKGIRVLINLKKIKYLWFKYKAFDLKRPSLDRIDSNRHYTIKNCQFIEHCENCRKDNLGEKCYFAKLTEKEVIEIKLMHKKGVKQVDLARRFNVAYGTIRSIISGRNWKHVKIKGGVKWKRKKSWKR